MSKKIWHCLGHGGSNHGCRHNGIYENNWVLQMAYDCGPSLMVWGLEVEYSRYEDLEVSYKDSAHNAKDWGADLAICHHVNALVFGKGHALEGEPDSRGHGLICFTASDTYREDSIADAIRLASPPQLQLQRHRAIIKSNPNNWTKNANYIISCYREYNIPTILIEWGFATSLADSCILKSPSYRYNLVACVMAGVARFLELENEPFDLIPQHSCCC